MFVWSFFHIFFLSSHCQSRLGIYLDALIDGVNFSFSHVRLREHLRSAKTLNCRIFWMGKYMFRFFWISSFPEFLCSHFQSVVGKETTLQVTFGKGVNDHEVSICRSLHGVTVLNFTFCKMRKVILTSFSDDSKIFKKNIAIFQRKIIIPLFLVAIPTVPKMYNLAKNKFSKENFVASIFRRGR